MTKDLQVNKLYSFLAILYLLGIFLYVTFGAYSFGNLSDWVLGYALIGATLVLIHYQIVLPPEGNSLSMDSAIYLACVFVFGVKIALTVLLFSNIIYFIYSRRDAWWAQWLNFSTYTVMIVGSHLAFIGLGGTVGEIDHTNVVPYIGALTSYFFINVLLIGLFFFLARRIRLLDAFKGVTEGVVESYLSTLLLSIILSFLLQTAPFFGLILFTSISVLLSYAFKHHFTLYQEVSNKANKDHLTGLNNHGYFKEILESTLDEVKQTDEVVSLAMIDIDDFKKYNDSHGHLQGDRLLTFFGQMLEETCREKEYVIARYGGEEFVILMRQTSEQDAARFIDCFRKQVNDTYFDGVELLPYGCLSFSAGIAGYSKDITSLSEFLSHADQAMYYAKSQGKNNTHIFGDEINVINLDQQIEELEQQLQLFLGKDIYTYRHSKRVYKYAVEFSKLLSLKDSEKKTFILGALIHDIGKLEVPRHVINKKEKLTKEEWEMIKKHVIWGRDIVAANKKLAPLVPLVELHHERYDGRGYPHGLKGEEIPKLARILCIVDSFDAMTTERPYQKTKSYQEALCELELCAGTQFDPDYVKPFKQYIENKYLLYEDTNIS
ncbi:bifunctional diguanylate cyclase/phosphohydrolase [Aquibacillus sediminis]|uniref:bifunctional diguanylate cyclase/phosphohydrolase n=1 Tax=Aquibacillus sediminis TaxID=2574734 RepID=UPI001108E868|nr:diguanylate cyclase [Aquibacillus sediminis]